jgi:hypothetical protein
MSPMSQKDKFEVISKEGKLPQDNEIKLNGLNVASKSKESENENG